MMTFIGSLLVFPLSIHLPTLVGWLGWGFLLGLAIWLRFKWKEFHPVRQKNFWALFGGLFLLAIPTNLFLGVHLHTANFLSWPGMPIESPGAAFLFFSALPWLLAAGMLGPTSAFIIGAFAGLIRAPWDTHTLFTALQFGLLAMLFSIAVRQRYRTGAYRALRQPLLSAILLIPVYSFLFIIGILLSAAHPEITARLDFAISNVGVTTLAFAGEMLVAGIIAQILVNIFPDAWGHNQPLKASPAEKHLATRFLIGTGTFVGLLLLTLLVGDWVVAGDAAKQMLEERLANTAQVSAESVPPFLEAGQNLGMQLAADKRLLSANPEELAEILGEKIHLVPYFNQMLILDANAKVLGGYPDESIAERSLTAEETIGITLAFNGVLSQTYTLPPAESGGARISFLIAMKNSEDQVERVLIGRSDLRSNPFTRPLLNSLDSMAELEGSGFLIDENGRILYHSNSSRVMDLYLGERPNETTFSEGLSSTSTRELIFFQPVVGQPWAVVLTVPAKQVQQLSLKIAAPLSAMILILALVALFSLRVGLRMISQSLETLAEEAGRIAQGQLDHPLETSGMDEVGQLRRAFEQMRVSLHDRIEESNQLLRVSRGVASSLDMEDAFRPVLEAIRSSGASAVHVILSPEIIPNTMAEIPSRFAEEPYPLHFAHLDAPILALARQQEKLVLPNMARTSGNLKIDSGLARPAALLAVALHTEHRFFGVLWAAYDQARPFTEADVRFISTLAGQAALAAANARLFLNVEVGRQQLESVLASTPDPVLVTDHQDRLLLANPAARQILDIDAVKETGRSIEKSINNPILLAMLKTSSTSGKSAEISLPSGQIYLATASAVLAEGRPVGRVCILRDVTHLKELDQMKSEFVATVSHDLRSPLTLMRGYATMLPMAGEINSKQEAYISKIISGVENMSSLINDLLDLGRIELGVGLQTQDVSILDLLDRSTGMLQAQAKTKNIILSVETDPNLPESIEADPTLLHQVVYNLIENALKYTRPEGDVKVRCFVRGDMLFFEVEDTGIGIKPEDRARLFEKFYRGTHREAHEQRGTGLGLAIVRSIVDLHGGRVWVESVMNQGSTFHVEIPLSQANNTL